MRGPSPASDLYRQLSVEAGMDCDRAELRARHAPLPELVGPAPPPKFHPDFPVNIGTDPQAFAAKIAESRRTRWAGMEAEPEAVEVGEEAESESVEAEA